MIVEHFNDILCILPKPFHVYYQKMIGLEKESTFGISLEDIKFDEKIFIKKTNIEQYYFEHEIKNWSKILGNSGHEEILSQGIQHFGNFLQLSDQVIKISYVLTPNLLISR